MNFSLVKGKDFNEHFDFKNANGKPIALPNGSFRVVLERGPFGREYTVGEGLSRGRTGLSWRIDGSESKDFDFTTMYYTLYLDNREITRGILRVQ